MCNKCNKDKCSCYDPCKYDETKEICFNSTELSEYIKQAVDNNIPIKGSQGPQGFYGINGNQGPEGIGVQGPEGVQGASGSSLNGLDTGWQDLLLDNPSIYDPFNPPRYRRIDNILYFKGLLMFQPATFPVSSINGEHQDNDTEIDQSMLTITRQNGLFTGFYINYSGGNNQGNFHNNLGTGLVIPPTYTDPRYRTGVYIERGLGGSEVQPPSISCATITGSGQTTVQDGPPGRYDLNYDVQIGAMFLSNPNINVTSSYITLTTETGGGTMNYGPVSFNGSGFANIGGFQDVSPMNPSELKIYIIGRNGCVYTTPATITGLPAGPYPITSGFGFSVPPDNPSPGGGGGTNKFYIPLRGLLDKLILRPDGFLEFRTAADPLNEVVPVTSGTFVGGMSSPFSIITSMIRQGQLVGEYKEMENSISTPGVRNYEVPTTPIAADQDCFASYGNWLGGFVVNLQGLFFHLD